MKLIKIYYYLGIFFTLFSLSFLSGCASYQQFQYITEEFEVPTEVFKYDYNQTWLAVLNVMKKYDLELQDQEAGVIKTRWIDNTNEMNFADSFGSKDAIKAAKFKIILNVVKGFRGKREVSKVTVYRRQMVEQDFLQGWKVVPSDAILEKGIIYRIKRNLEIAAKLKKIEEERSKELEATF